MARAPELALLLALSGVLLAACGWHLRGSYDLPAAIVPVAVDGGTAIGRQLRRNLARVGATGPGEPASRLEILEEEDDRRVVSVDEDGKVNEYEVRYTVRWQLTAPSGTEKGQRVLIAPRTLRASRNYDFDPGSVLSKSDEERVRIETMRDDLAQQILFRLQGWKPARGESAGEGSRD